MSQRQIKKQRKADRNYLLDKTAKVLMDKIQVGKVNSFLEIIRKCSSKEDYEQTCTTVSESGLPVVLYCSEMDYHLLEPSFSPYCKVEIKTGMAEGKTRFDWTLNDNNNG